MAQRSSGPGSRRTKQHNHQQFHDGQPASRGDKGKTIFPPIGRDNIAPAQYSTSQCSMTGKLGIPSRHRQPMVALPTDNRHIEADRSKAHQRMSPKDISGKSQTHGQRQACASPKTSRSIKRSESCDLKRASSGHRRSSSTSSVPQSVLGSSKHLPGDEVPAGFSGRSEECRQTESHDVWTGSGYDLIAHRTPHHTRVSTKKESPHSVKDSDGRDLLAQSALKNSPTHRYQPSQYKSSTSSNGSHGRLLPQFDALTVTQSRTHGPAHSVPQLYNANNNSSTPSTQGSPTTALSLSASCSSSNGGHPQSDPFSPSSHQVSPPWGEGLSGGGAGHSKQKQYKTNGTVSTRAPSEAVYVARSTGGSHMSHRSASPPYKASKVRGCAGFLSQYICTYINVCLCVCSMKYVVYT